MQVLKFEFDVKRELPFVFENIYREDVYRMWANAFSPRGHYVGEFRLGEELKFLDDNANGVSCIVNKIITNEYLEFLVTHEIYEGISKKMDEAGYEKYDFSALDDHTTHIVVHVDVPQENVGMTTDMWNIAIESVTKTLESL